MAIIRKTLKQILKEKELSNEIRFSYDNDIDAIYFTLIDVPSKDSEEIANGIIVDYDEHDTIIGIEILDFHKKIENGLTIDDLPLTDEQKERIPRYLFIRDEDIDFSDIPALTDEQLDNGIWIDPKKQSFWHWLMLPLRENYSQWEKHFKKDDKYTFWRYLSGHIASGGIGFGYQKHRRKPFLTNSLFRF